MNQHKTKWTVIYPNGHRAHFADEESARHEAYMYGIGLVPPLYR